MSRELKFRYWDKIENIMWYPREINCGEPRMSHWVNSEDEEGILMQFTTLKDKNGIEIYEGDILDCDCGNRKVKVVWHNPSASFDTEPVGDIGILPFKVLQNQSWRYRCEIIGNRYENPELWKG